MTKRVETSVRAQALLCAWALAVAMWSLLPQAVECQPSWDVVTAPSPSGSECVLRSVQVVSPHEAWAVGIYQSESYDNRSLILHYANDQWTWVPSPNPGSPCTDGNLQWGGNALAGVDVVSDDDVWAVGSGCYSYATLIEHWNGSTWSIVPSPTPYPGEQNELIGVAAISSNDVWAVGYTNSSAGVAPLIEHWNGVQWSVASSPRFTSTASLAAVSGIAANDVWAVGNYYDNAEMRAETLILHWNGVSWSRVASVDPGNQNSLQSVVALSANNVWAVGGHSSGAANVTLIEHWDGHSWQVVPSPNIDASSGSSNTLRSISAVSPTSIYAAGAFTGEATIHQRRTLVMHWDGASWELQGPPSPGSSSEVNAIAAGPYEENLCVGVFSQYPVDIYDGHYTLAEALLMGQEAAARAPLDVGPQANAGPTLGLASPNPTRGRVSFTMQMPTPAEIRFSIFDLRGRMVRTIFSGAVGAGQRSEMWDGLDANGRGCAPGLYFGRLETGGRVVESRAVTLLR